MPVVARYSARRHRPSLIHGSKDTMSPSRPRIALIHATPLSLRPIAAAFSELWPEARTFNVLDDSLAPDKERGDSAPELMFRRFADLTRYAVSCGSEAILFTCSAF